MLFIMFLSQAFPGIFVDQAHQVPDVPAPAVRPGGFAFLWQIQGEGARQLPVIGKSDRTSRYSDRLFHQRAAVVKALVAGQIIHNNRAFAISGGTAGAGTGGNGDRPQIADKAVRQGWGSGTFQRGFGSTASITRHCAGIWFSTSWQISVSFSPIPGGSPMVRYWSRISRSSRSFRDWPSTGRAGRTLQPAVTAKPE